MPGSPILGESVGALWIHTLVPSTGAVSAVVWWGWYVGTFGVRLSRSLEFRCPVAVSYNTNSILFRILVPLSSLGLPHIFLEVLRWGGPCPFYFCIWYQIHLPLTWNLYLYLCVYIVLGWFLPVHTHKVVVAPWVLHHIWYQLAPGHKSPFWFWHICICHIACWVGHICLWSLHDIQPCVSRRLESNNRWETVTSGHL